LCFDFKLAVLFLVDTIDTSNAVDNSTGNVGIYASNAIGTDGLPVISFSDEYYTDLMVVHCSNTFCVPYWRRW
jgi:hypothetical protein